MNNIGYFSPPARDEKQPLCTVNESSMINTEHPNSIEDVEADVHSIIVEADAENSMVDNIFHDLSKDMNIVVCGSPRVGKSTLINAICGREVCIAGTGLASITSDITCHTMKGQLDTASKKINYQYNFWDTPGFEAWSDTKIKAKVEDILQKPNSKPLCLIFCAAPTSFGNLDRLEWLLDLCMKKHIFCALVCTNMYAGGLNNRKAVLNNYDKLLSKYITDSPKEENGVKFYGNIGLTIAINSEPFETDDGVKPASGVNELIYGIMESLVDEKVVEWLLVVLENKGFWDKHLKLDRIERSASRNFKRIKKLLRIKKDGK